MHCIYFLKLLSASSQIIFNSSVECTGTRGSFFDLEIFRTSNSSFSDSNHIDSDPTEEPTTQRTTAFKHYWLPGKLKHTPLKIIVIIY